LKEKEKTKEEKVRTLITMSGSGDMGIQMIDTLIPQYKKMLPDVPESYWIKVKKNVDVNELIDLIIPIYVKYYTDDDITKLIEFYESDIGQKMIKISPLMMQDSMDAGQAWGEKMGEKIIIELTEDGYISE